MRENLIPTGRWHWCMMRKNLWHQWPSPPDVPDSLLRNRPEPSPIPADMDEYHGWRWLPKGHCHCGLPASTNDLPFKISENVPWVTTALGDNKDATDSFAEILEYTAGATYLIEAYRIQITRQENVVSKLAGRQGRAIVCVNGALAGTGVSPAKDVEDIARVVRELVARIK